MKKHVFGRKFKRDKNERTALFKGLMSSLVMHESIKTTEEKAKAIKADFDKLFTIAKKGGQLAYRRLESEVSAVAAKKLVDELATRSAGRTSGYTRILKLGRRFNDDAMVVVMELVDKRPVIKESKGTKERDETKGKITEGEIVENTTPVSTKTLKNEKAAAKPKKTAPKTKKAEPKTK